MNSVEVNAALDDLVSKYGLRYVESTRRYLGIHEGMGIDIVSFERCLTLTVFSPGAVINDQILEDFPGFTHVKESGVLTSWIRGVPLENHQNSPDTVRMELTPQRLKQISGDQLIGLPARLAEDLRQFGGAASITHCACCGAEHPSGLLIVDASYLPACDNCQTRVRDDAKMGVIEGATNVRWFPAISALVAGGLLFALLWGGMQQGRAFPMKVLLVAPFCGAIGLSILVSFYATGTSLILRIATALVSLAAVLAGNIWGLRAAVLRDIPGAEPPSWGEVTGLYFHVQLAQNDHVEGIYLLGGLAGAWVGMGVAKSFGQVRVE